MLIATARTVLRPWREADEPAYAGYALAMAQRMLSWRLNKADRTLTGIRLSRNGPLECPRERRFAAAS